MAISTERNESEVDLLVREDAGSLVRILAPFLGREWTLHGGVKVWRESRVQTAAGGGVGIMRTRPLLVAAVTASRQPEFFFWNLFIISVRRLFENVY